MATIFINEFHYTGTDNQFVEIAGPAGSDLSNYSVVVYNNDGTILKTEPLSDTIQNQGDGFGTVAVEFDDIPEDGAIALLDNGALVGTAANNDLQFLSYGGTVTASINSNSVTSSDIGVVETATTASLQLQGTDGDASSDFKWKRVNAGASKGAINSDQTFDNTQATGDEDGPELAGGATALSNTAGTSAQRDDNLVVTFNESVEIGTGNIFIKKTSDDSVVETIDVTDEDRVTTSGTDVTIDPENDLVDSTQYYVEFQNGSIKDLAGNNYEVDSSDKADTTFTIAPQAPRVVSTSFDDDSETSVDESDFVPVDASLVYTFDEEVKEGPTGTIRLYRESDGNPGLDFTNDTQILTSSTFGGKTITIKPSSPLQGGAVHYIDFTPNIVRDNDGAFFNDNDIPASISADQKTFTTAASDAPQVTNQSPTVGFDDVLVGDNIEITFNEDVVAGDGDIVIKKDDNDSDLTNDVEVASTVTFDGNKVIIDPTSDLEADTDYYVEIASDAIEDTSGNNFAGISGNTYNFNTVDDITAPELDSTTPEDDTENVPTDSTLTIKFDEDVKAGEGKIFVKEADGTVFGEVTLNKENNSNGTVAGTNLSVSGLSYDDTSANNDVLNDTITLTLTNDDLDPSTEYYVEIEKGAITDLVGNEYEGFTDSDIFNFTTASSEGPVIINQTPNDNATNVAIDAPLVIEFNEDVEAGVISSSNSNSGSISLKSADGSDVRFFNVRNGANGQLDISDDTITITPNNPLKADTNYFVEIAPTAVQAIDDDKFDGFFGDTAFNFTTAESDAPVAIGFSTDDDDTTPENENESVAINSNLSITFNEAVQEGDGFITLFNADGTKVEFNVDEPEVQSDGNTITINPSADLESNTTYYVQVDAGAIEDLGGEAFGGINDTTTFRFTTNDEMAPAVVAGSESPADNATDVAIDADISFNLGEDVTAVAGKNITITPVGGTPITIAADDTTQVSIVNGVVTINPTADLMNGQEYTVEVESGAFIDGANNEFDGTLAADGFNFTTVADNNSGGNNGGGNNGGGTVITPIAAGSPIGTVTDNGNVMEVIDLTGAQFAGQTVTASFEVSREADYDNNVYFYTVDAADGNIGGLAPDASGYLQAALNNVVGSAINAQDGANDDMGSFTLQGGDILGIAIVADGTLTEATSDISSVEGVYLSYMGANTDNGSFDHIKFENNMFKFEDLANGGDADFNDIEISIDFTV